MVFHSASSATATWVICKGHMNLLVDVLLPQKSWKLALGGSKHQLVTTLQMVHLVYNTRKNQQSLIWFDSITTTIIIKVLTKPDER
jgi:hypothetical protein